MVTTPEQHRRNQLEELEAEAEIQVNTKQNMKAKIAALKA
jgi:hypothetical protein